MTPTYRDVRVLALHGEGLSPMQISDVLAKEGISLSPADVQNRLLWLLMPKPHVRSA